MLELHDGYFGDRLNRCGDSLNEKLKEKGSQLSFVARMLTQRAEPV